MTAVFAFASLACLLASLVFHFRTLFTKGRRMEMLGKASLSFIGSVAVIIALGMTVEADVAETPRSNI